MPSHPYARGDTLAVEGDEGGPPVAPREVLLLENVLRRRDEVSRPLTLGDEVAGEGRVGPPYRSVPEVGPRTAARVTLLEANLSSVSLPWTSGKGKPFASILNPHLILSVGSYPTSRPKFRVETIVIQGIGVRVVTGV